MSNKTPILEFDSFLEFSYNSFIDTLEFYHDDLDKKMELYNKLFNEIESIETHPDEYSNSKDALYFLYRLRDTFENLLTPAEKQEIENRAKEESKSFLLDKIKQLLDDIVWNDDGSFNTRNFLKYVEQNMSFKEVEEYLTTNREQIINAFRNEGTEQGYPSYIAYDFGLDNYNLIIDEIIRDPKTIDKMPVQENQYFSQEFLTQLVQDAAFIKHDVIAELPSINQFAPYTVADILDDIISGMKIAIDIPTNSLDTLTEQNKINYIKENTQYKDICNTMLENVGLIKTHGKYILEDGATRIPLSFIIPESLKEKAKENIAKYISSPNVVDVFSDKIKEFYTQGKDVINKSYQNLINQIQPENIKEYLKGCIEDIEYGINWMDENEGCNFYPFNKFAEQFVIETLKNQGYTIPIEIIKCLDCAINLENKAQALNTDKGTKYDDIDKEYYDCLIKDTVNKLDNIINEMDKTKDIYNKNFNIDQSR